MSNNYLLMRSKFIKLCLLPFIPLLGFNALGQQPRDITGKVTSAENQEALIGVSVMVKGSANGTSTIGNGQYSIRSNSADTLVFTYVGFNEARVAVGNRTTINITLNSPAKGLNEVVVTALGIR